jgi:hypothetical protein
MELINDIDHDDPEPRGRSTPALEHLADISMLADASPPSARRK